MPGQDRLWLWLWCVRSLLVIASSVLALALSRACSRRTARFVGAEARTSPLGVASVTFASGVEVGAKGTGLPFQ